MRLRLSTTLDVPAERAWAMVQRPCLLDHIAWPVQAFEPIDPPVLPAVWREGRYLVRLKLFGRLPISTQWIAIDLAAQGPDRYEAHDRGHGSLMSLWDHRIIIEPLSPSRCRYTDSVELHAGLLTPLAWAFSQLFFRHRQRRWRALVAADFAPLGPAATISIPTR